MSSVGWKLACGGRTPPPGAVVRPGERLSSLRMPGLGAQHVVAMSGAVAAATRGGVLGGITLVLYGMTGLLGAKIWIENRVNFADPVNLVPLAAGIIAGVGTLAIKFTSTFSISGIAAGTLIVITGYHGVRLFARRPLDEPQAGGVAYEGGTMIATGNIETPEGGVSPFRENQAPVAGHGRDGGEPPRTGEGGSPGQ